jgi:hypothetical protein
MFLGRVGPVAFIVAMTVRQRPMPYKYPQEDIAIGKCRRWKPRRGSSRGARGEPFSGADRLGPP